MRRSTPSTSATGGNNSDIQFLSLIERTEDAEYIHTGFRSLFAYLVNYVNGIVGISHGVGATQQNMKWNVWYLLPQCFKKFPGKFVQEAHGEVKGYKNPHLKGEGVP